MSQAKGGRSGGQEEPPPEPDTGTGPEGDATREGGPGHGHGHGQGQGHECLDWCPICRSAELMKGINSPEVRQQLQSIQSEAMHVFRAFAAAYAERTGDDPFSRGRDARGEDERREPEKPNPADTPIDISIE